MLRKATVKDSIVFIVSVHYSCLQPLVIAVADEALAILKVLGAVHLAMRSIVRTECLILTNSVLHHGTSIVHLRVDYLTTSPLFLREWRLINVKDLVPGAHQVSLIQLLLKGLDVVTDDILSANLAIVDGFKGLRDRHFYANKYFVTLYLKIIIKFFVIISDIS